jgi:hypothetical protein
MDRQIISLQLSSLIAVIIRFPVVLLILMDVLWHRRAYNNYWFSSNTEKELENNLAFAGSLDSKSDCAENKVFYLVTELQTQ